ncbi:unnamed protein product [Diabrotica balteata]|uniref:Uncharacterized protein n=1 Tax=Diabrotica balteata TaxID=107213 RepID=A0A9N9TCQ1_DIABA|nr:unnamed protein product [Diabrotica balteata]
MTVDLTLTVSAVVTDKSANMVKVVEIAVGKTEVPPLFCPHTKLQNMLLKIKAIVTYFKHNCVESDELRNAVRGEAETKLIQDVSTRWNSTYYMTSEIFGAEKFGK